jgi:3'-phosphoadenosine 5'-phosphosulfate sulfotransferase (PAPS reductase)/FAD synthetase
VSDLGWDELPTADADDVLGEAWEPYSGDERPIGPDGTWLNSRALCAWVRERSEHLLVGFSMGKDSISTWHRLREFWPAANLHPYHLYMSPHLGNEERSLRYYEREFGTKIMRLPNRSVFRLLNDGAFQSPANLPVIWGAQLPDFRYRDIYDLMAVDLGIEETKPWVAHGVRSADSPMRRMLLQKHGPWRPSERVFYPIHDWYVADVRRCLTETGTKLPVDYRLYGRSFDGLDARFTGPLRKHFPEDYAALTDLYPLVGLDLWRRGGDKPDE